MGIPPAMGVSCNSASSEMSHTLGAPDCAYDSSRKGLRVRLGERSGEDGRARGTGESVWKPLGLATVGIEWARSIGGALSKLELLWERRCGRAYGERVRGRGWCAGVLSAAGSVKERGVDGRRGKVLMLAPVPSSDELLTWRERLLLSSMMAESWEGAAEVVMALSRWMRSSAWEPSEAEEVVEGWFAAVMAMACYAQLRAGATINGQSSATSAPEARDRDRVVLECA
jgi:hypothetical protein